MSDRWSAQYDAGVPRHLQYPDYVLPDQLFHTVRQWPGHPALRYYGRTITYADLGALVERFAAGAAAIGLRSGRTFGIMLPNLPQTVVAFYGALRAGAQVTFINPLYVEAEVEQQTADAACDTVLVLDQFFPRVEPLLRRGHLKQVVVTGPQDFLPWFKRLLFPLKQRRERKHAVTPQGPGVVPLHTVLASGRPIEPPAVPADAVALLQYTGGTTGTPKGVVLTHRNLVSNAWQVRHWIPALQEGGERFLMVLPWFHVYGMLVGHLGLSMGAALVLLPRFVLAEVLETIARERVTIFPGIPAMYTAINQHPRLDRYDLTSIRLCISGAGALHAAVQERFEAITGARLVEGYGLTEASPVTHWNPVMQKPEQRRRRSIGLPLPDTEARIMDVETGERELPVGEIGELVIRGPQVMQGYLHREEETKQVLRGGWLYTGDMARMDADGYFYIEDRKKDMIKSGGENVYPREVEEVLVRHPKVKEAVVVGIPLGIRGELIKAYVVLKEGQQATAAELLEHCRNALAKFKVPRKIELRRELPKTVVGKVLRRVLIAEELKKAERHGADDEAD